MNVYNILAAAAAAQARGCSLAQIAHAVLNVKHVPGRFQRIDNGQPFTAPYVICLSNGCMAEYEASDELIAKMKSGQNLHVQAINGSRQPISIPIPLADFAKAHDGPPIDPKELEQQEKK